MNIQTIKKLQQLYVGNLCTVVTVAGKQGFTDMQFGEFFTGIIESIDQDGIFARHHLTGCMAFYHWPHIVGVVGEQYLDPSNPEHAKIIEELQKQQSPQQATQVAVPTPPPGVQFVNPDVMANLAQQAQELQQKMLRKQ